MRYIAARLVYLSVLAFLLSRLAPAQESASLYGHIADASTSPIPAASVAVRNVETGALRSLVTDKDGLYEAAALPVGRYEVTAMKEGFDSASRKGVVLVVGQRAEVDLQLAVGQLKQIVTVEDHPPVVSVTTEQTSGLVGERQVKDLP